MVSTRAPIRPLRAGPPPAVGVNSGGVRDAASDGADGEGVTALFWPSGAWDPTYAGETVFLSDDGDAMQAVLPRPGRLVLVSSSWPRVSRPPSRLVWAPLFTILVVFEPSL